MSLNSFCHHWSLLSSLWKRITILKLWKVELNTCLNICSLSSMSSHINVNHTFLIFVFVLVLPCSYHYIACFNHIALGLLLYLYECEKELCQILFETAAANIMLRIFFKCKEDTKCYHHQKLIKVFSNVETETEAC